MAYSTTTRRARPSRARVQPTSPRRPRRLWLALSALLVITALVAGVFFLNQGERAGAIARLTTADFHALAIGPTDPNTVFFGHHNGVMRSADGGRSWQPLVEQRNFDAMGLAVSAAAPERLYLAGHDIFQVSADGGRTWRPVQHGLPGTDIHAFAVSSTDPSRLYALVVGQGALTSADAGLTWTSVSGLPADVTALAVAGGQPETVYAASLRGGVLTSTDGGQTWAPAGEGLPGRVMTLAVSPAASQTIYAGTDSGLFRGVTAGATWEKLPFPGANVAALAVSPTQPEIVLVISVEDRQGRVYRSEDGGLTWGPGA